MEQTFHDEKGLGRLNGPEDTLLRSPTEEGKQIRVEFIKKNIFGSQQCNYILSDFDISRAVLWRRHCAVSDLATARLPVILS